MASTECETITGVWRLADSLNSLGFQESDIFSLKDVLETSTVHFQF